MTQEREVVTVGAKLLNSREGWRLLQGEGMD